MKQINPNIYPNGGFLFKERDGSVHTANSWSGVAARVRAYRKRRGWSIDRTDQDVIDQACSRTPVLCVEDDGTTRAQQSVVSLKGRVLKWLVSIRRAKEAEEVHRVDAGLHAARTDVCIRCPLDKGMDDSGCGSCRAALKELKTAVVGDHETDSRIHACPVLGEYLPVSTWLDLQTGVNDALPPECWRKRTL